MWGYNKNSIKAVTKIDDWFTICLYKTKKSERNDRKSKMAAIQT